MSILLAGLLLSAWGLLVLSAPKRKRYRRWRCIGDSSIDGEANDSSSAYDPVGDAGGGDAGGDVGGGDCGGSDGGSCGGGD
jgi:hypothetical protein